MRISDWSSDVCSSDLAIARDTQPIVRHILDRFPRLNVEEREALEQLRTLPWLPGSLNGERVQGKRFAPSLVYRSFRSPGFLSQRMVVDLPILRGTQGGRSLIERSEERRVGNECVSTS